MVYRRINHTDIPRGLSARVKMCDLLEDRRTINAIISEFLPLRFKMAESFENLG